MKEKIQRLESLVDGLNKFYSLKSFRNFLKNTKPSIVGENRGIELDVSQL